MTRILGVFNTACAVELVVRGLSVLQDRDNAHFWLCTDERAVMARELRELREQEAKALPGTLHCIACASRQPVHSRITGVNRLVADAELYNMPELKERYQLEGETSNAVLQELLERAQLNAHMIDGAYACAFWTRTAADEEALYLLRDLLGLRPLCFAHAHGGFAFASEKKVLEAMGFPHAVELEPRIRLRYRLKGDRLQFLTQGDFPVTPELTGPEQHLKENVLRMLRASIARRVPQDEKVGVLFSGGVDSTLLAYLCKEQYADFVCYTAVVDDPAWKPAEDLRYATRIAADLGVPLTITKIELEQLDTLLQKVVPLLDDLDGIKVSVALPLYAAAEQAKKDGVATVLYGLGTEELFAGYERHRHVRPEAVNRECRSGLLLMHERDLYRDDVMANAQGISLRAPFLAPELVAYALRIPAAYKLAAGEDKAILRAIARDLGLAEAANRKKRAVQYGANVMKALAKLAKQAGFRYTRDYLRTFFPARNLRLGALFSSGKDSTFALWLMQKAGYPVECLITIKSQNPESYMFHTPAVELSDLQAEAMGMPLITQETAGEEEQELEDLCTALRAAKQRYGIEGVVTGALWSTYQKDRIERIAGEEQLRVFSPLWHIHQETELRLVINTFAVIFTAVSAYGLDSSWLGRRITTADVDRLVALNEQLTKYGRRTAGLNIAGEGGEFESLVLDGPLFNKRLVIKESEIREEGEHTARLLVKKAVLEEKRAQYQ
ncbi:MAG TPA: diphthine--ammonia ligase [Methanomicrobia archaeon]|nr:diphthine--ammonia ligase [Methanomicrobia archaeon]